MLLAKILHEEFSYLWIGNTQSSGYVENDGAEVRLRGTNSSKIKLLGYGVNALVGTGVMAGIGDDIHIVICLDGSDEDGRHFVFGAEVCDLL